MKQFLTILAIISVAMYSIIAFISFLPNPQTWDVGGRAAFIVFDLAFTITGFAITEETKKR